MFLTMTFRLIMAIISMPIIIRAVVAQIITEDESFCFIYAFQSKPDPDKRGFILIFKIILIKKELKINEIRMASMGSAEWGVRSAE